MAEDPTSSFFTPLSDKLLPCSPSPMFHDDGVAELVLESGQLLARRPPRSLMTTRFTCPSQLDKLTTECEEAKDDKDPPICASGKPPRPAAPEEHMWMDSHLVPDYKDNTDTQPLNNDIIPEVPDNHPSNPNLSNECNVGWGPFAQMHHQKPDRNEPRLHNFAHFLRPSRLSSPDGRQSTNSCSTSSANNPNSISRLDRMMSSTSGKTPADGSIPVESTLVESGSRSVKALGNQLGLLATGEPKIEATKDEQRDQPGADTSVCSLAASNNLERLKRKNTDAELQQGRKRKRRSAEIHSQSEKRRRAKINKKLLLLQEMIPNASKVDKASLLDDAIEYLKTLQLQLQMMAMGRGLMMHPMMVPGMQAPQMAQLPSMGMGMGMGINMPMGLGCIPNPFSTSPVLGVPGQMLPVPVPMPQLQPFGNLPTGGASSNPSVPVSAVELLGSAPMVGLRNAIQNTIPEAMNINDTKAE